MGLFIAVVVLQFLLVSGLPIYIIATVLEKKRFVEHDGLYGKQAVRSTEIEALWEFWRK